MLLQEQPVNRPVETPLLLIIQAEALLHRSTQAKVRPPPTTHRKALLQLIIQLVRQPLLLEPLARPPQRIIQITQQQQILLLLQVLPLHLQQHMPPLGLLQHTLFRR